MVPGGDVNGESALRVSVTGALGRPPPDDGEFKKNKKISLEK